MVKDKEFIKRKLQTGMRLPQGTVGKGQEIRQSWPSGKMEHGSERRGGSRRVKGADPRVPELSSEVQLFLPMKGNASRSTQC